jgi:hypothetical protein
MVEPFSVHIFFREVQTAHVNPLCFKLKQEACCLLNINLTMKIKNNGDAQWQVYMAISHHAKSQLELVSVA